MAIKEWEKNFGRVIEPIVKRYFFYRFVKLSKMTIPWTFYIEYWLKNSLLALATGFLISFMIPPLFAMVPYFGLLVLLLYQVVICRHFWGKKRGDFEFVSKESLIKKQISSLIKLHLGFRILVRFKFDKLNNIVVDGWDIYEKLSSFAKDQEENIQFYLYHIAADLSRKEGDVKKEQGFLLKALSLCPNDFITNFRVAVTAEREDKAQESIEYYKKALEASAIDSDQLKQFISEQIARVETKGPLKSTPMPGLRFMSW